MAMDALTIVFLIVSTIIFGLLIYVAVMGLSSKTKAKDKVIWIFVVAAIGVWLIPLVGGAIGGVLTTIGDVFSFIPNTTNQMGNLAVILIFLMLLIVIKYLIDLPWDKAVWVTLLSLFLLYLLFSIIPYIGSYMMSPL